MTNLIKSFFKGTPEAINIRVSRIFFETPDCPFTGFYMDDVLLQPIHDFIKKPLKYKHWTMEDLLQDCLNSWLIACDEDYEYCQSREYAIDCIQVNEYEFYVNGSKY